MILLLKGHSPALVGIGNRRLEHLRRGPLTVVLHLGPDRKVRGAHQSGEGAARRGIAIARRRIIAVTV